jgi:hypothetical protein
MSSSELELRFHGKAYAVPERVVDLLDRRNLFAVRRYAVECSISVEIFEALVVSLQTQAKVSVTGTKENAASLSFVGTVVGVFVRCSLDSSGTSSAEKSVSKVEIPMKQPFFRNHRWRRR